MIINNFEKNRISFVVHSMKCMNISIPFGGSFLLYLFAACMCNSSLSGDNIIITENSVTNDSLKRGEYVGQNSDVDIYSYTIVNDTPEELSDKCDNDGIYTSLAHSPEYPGGVQAFLEYLNDNFVYPKEAALFHVRGVIVVRFIVEKDGTISNAKVVRRVAPDNADFHPEKLSLIDDEAVRLVNGMPKWIPGKHNGETVRAYFEVPVRIRINRNQKSNNSQDVAIY